MARVTPEVVAGSLLIAIAAVFALRVLLELFVIWRARAKRKTRAR